MVDQVDDLAVDLQVDGVLVVYFLEDDALEGDCAEVYNLDVHSIHSHKRVDDHSHVNNDDHDHTNHRHTKHNPIT
jgi:hypothetical protein